ncbi:MAG TPA: DUF1345 domain-containing protein, partial [Xanthobacteraceae bacterium]|nr:DUF1345 domain-containing protein [Xanthobacteraceae bacterium]
MSTQGTPSQVARRRLPRVVRIVRARPRLFISAALGAALGLVLPPEWRLVTRMLVGWDAAAV